MGPSPLGDGKRRDVGSIGLPNLLQWGRRLLATESGERGRGCPRREPASMGPSPLGDGKCTIAGRANLCSIWLQWGRRLLATERPVWHCESSSPMRSLQWGRRLLATER